MGTFGAVFRVGNLFRKFGEETLEIPSSLWPASDPPDPPGGP